MTPQIDDLEADLRAMLRARANDVTTVPDSTFAFERPHTDLANGDVVPLQTGRRGTWRVGRSPLLAAAAAVVAVLVTVTAIVALRGDGDKHSAPPANTGDPRPTVSRTTTVPQPDTGEGSASLTVFGLSAPSGYDFGDTEIVPGRQTRSLQKLGDDGKIPGTNGGSPYQSFVSVFDKGRFDGATTKSWRKIDLDGRTALVGKAALNGGDGYRYTTLAWQSDSGRWVLVQGRSAEASTDAELLKVAREVRLDDPTSPVLLPFQLGYVPAGSRVTRVYSDSTGQYPDDVELTSTAGTVQIMRAASIDRLSFERAGSQPRSIDGQRVYVDRSSATAVVTFDKDSYGIRVNPPAETGKPTSTQLAELDKMLGSMSFHVRQGEQALTLEQALP